MSLTNSLYDDSASDDLDAASSESESSAPPSARQQKHLLMAQLASEAKRKEQIDFVSQESRDYGNSIEGEEKHTRI